jgi:hypothetical protein
VNALPSEPPLAPSPQAQARRLAVSTWENEGGSELGPPPAAEPPVASAECVQLLVRVIALENLVIALLADASEHQRATALEMAGFISPRPGFTPHPLTLRAAEAMRSLLDRAERFRRL